MHSKLYHHNQWKYAGALMITFDKGSASEPAGKHGYTHIAEHLLFSGTRTHSHVQLREIFFRTFDHIEATTSREQVKIFATFDMSDIDEVIDTLTVMIFHWHCPPEQWDQEKQSLENEIKDYNASPASHRQHSLMSLLPMPQHPVMGTSAALQAYTYQHVDDIQKYWQEVVQTAQRYATLIGSFTAEQVAAVTQLCTQKTTSSERVFSSRTVAMQQNQNTVAIIIKGQPHAYHLLWDRILYFRCKDHPSGYENSYTVFQETSILSLYHPESIDTARARDLLTSPITQKEFEYVKNIFLKFLRGTLDCMEPINALHWFSGFQVHSYAPWNAIEPEMIYQQFQELTYAAFVAYRDEVISSLKD